ncbi:MAG: hypothetical protein GYA17_08060 [Chloroflexi bacterium]|nr:hypothetical protein [Chloroflexota bacterium]
MAEIRCTKCGKLNPEDAFLCQYCLAPLGGLEEPGDAADSPNLGDTDWLRGLRGGVNGPEDLHDEEATPDAAGEADVPDWLERIRQRNKLDTGDQDDESIQEDEGAPPWMQGGAEEPASADQAEETFTFGQEPGTLADEGEFGDTPFISADAGSGEGAPDWLKDLENWEPTGARDASAGPAESTADPFFAGGQIGEGETGEGEGFPDWLRSGGQDLPSPAQDAAPAEELPDWLSGASFPTADAAAEQDSAPQQDFSLHSDAEALPFSEESQAGGASAFSFTDEDQTGAAGAFSFSDEDQTGGAETFSFSEEEPSGSIAAFSSSGAGLVSGPEELPAEEIPDWLQSLNTTEVQTGAPQAPETPLDRLSFDQAEGEETPAVSPESWTPPVEEAGAVPAANELNDDFLQALSDLEAQQREPAGDEAEETEAEVSAPGFFSAMGGEALPDWLSQIGEQEEETPADSSIPAFIFDDEGEGSSASMTGHPFAGENMPEWLGEGARQEETSGAGPQAADLGSDDLAPANLPGWLEAMRPVETVIPGSLGTMDDTRIENIGPLAGLPGILPTEDIPLQYRKPPVYSNKLQVTERQRLHATLLENLIEQEDTPRPLVGETIQVPQLMLRILVGVVLILALLIPILLGGQPVAVDAPLTAEVGAFHSQVESLPEGAPVLLAVEYEPGFAPELEMTASSLVQRLIDKRARVALVSTTLSGPVLGESLVKRAYSDMQVALPGALGNVDLSNQVVNLGFVPGGETGLQEFAMRPQQTTRYGFNTALDGQPAWTHAALQNVNQLSDFFLVIVLSDGVETARSWVEQVQPALNGAPMLLVTSAQAAPLLQPYYASGQVQGIVGGLQGGITYSQLVQAPGRRPAYWDAYRLGIYLAVFLVLGGAIYQGVIILLRRKS